MLMTNFNDTEMRNKYIFAKLVRVKALNKIPEPLREGDRVLGYIFTMPKVGGYISMAQEERNGIKSVDVFNSSIIKSMEKENNTYTILTDNSEYLMKVLEN